MAAVPFILRQHLRANIMRSEREDTMKTTKTKGMFNHLGLAGALAGVALAATALADDAGQWDHHRMELSSTEFSDGGVLPISAIFESATSSGTNACSVDGSTGGTPRRSFPGGMRRQVPGHSR